MSTERIHEAKVKLVIETSHRTIEETITCGEDETIQEWTDRVKARTDEIVETIW